MAKTKIKLPKINLVTATRRRQIEQAVAEVIAKRTSSVKKHKLDPAKIIPVYVVPNKKVAQ